MSKNIGQAGRPVALFGARVGVPANLEPCVERHYFSDLHYLALVCDDDVLAHRRRDRPVWRQSGDPAFVEGHIQPNRWFKAQTGKTVSAIELLDTTHLSVADAAERVVV